MKTLLFLLVLVGVARADEVQWPAAMRGGTLQRLSAKYAGGLPSDFDQWADFLKKTGEMNQNHSYVPFSDAPAFTSLEEPRLIASNSGRFFIGAIPRKNGTVDFELMDWRKSRIENGAVVPGEFVFAELRGVTHGLFGNAPAKTPLKVEVIEDRQKCQLCHRTGGPIFTDRPWIGVTGANAPIGQYQSFAMLTKLVQLAPATYGQYAPLLSDPDSEFNSEYGDLKGPHAKELGALMLHGFPLFQFRAVFDFDANMRRATLLLYTDQLLNALPASRRPAFVADLLRAALRSSVFPRDLGALFSWRPFLERVYRRELGEKAVLSARHSPVLRDYLPIFDNPEWVGKLIPQITGSPIPALLQASDYLEKTGAGSYPDADKPSQESRFIDFDPAWEGNSGWGALDLLCDLTKADLANLQRRFADQEKEWQDLVGDPAFERLAGPGVFPEREALLGYLSGTAPAPAPVDRERRLAEGKARCLECHGGDEPSAKVMPFNPMDTEAWEKALADQKTHDKTAHWIDRIIVKLGGGSMPPEDSEQRKGFSLQDADWQELLTFLKGLPK